MPLVETYPTSWLYSTCNVLVLSGQVLWTPQLQNQLSSFATWQCKKINTISKQWRMFNMNRSNQPEQTAISKSHKWMAWHSPSPKLNLTNTKPFFNESFKRVQFWYHNIHRRLDSVREFVHKTYDCRVYFSKGLKLMLGCGFCLSQLQTFTINTYWYVLHAQTTMRSRRLRSLSTSLW